MAFFWGIRVEMRHFVLVSRLPGVLLAVLLDTAIQAIGTQGFADISAVEQYPVVGLETHLGGDVTGQITLNIVRRLAL